MLPRVQEKRRSASWPSVEAGGGDLWQVDNIHCLDESSTSSDPHKRCLYFYLSASFA